MMQILNMYCVDAAEASGGSISGKMKEWAL